jgi:hypothetical protein
MVAFDTTSDSISRVRAVQFEALGNIEGESGVCAGGDVVPLIDGRVS